MQPPPHEITDLLQRVRSGDDTAVDALMPCVYQVLRTLAARQLQRERSGHTLSATALVHEAYLKLIDQRSTDWKNRAHFFAIAARMMRRILINHAQKWRADKRGGGHVPIALDEQIMTSAPARTDDLLHLNEALKRLGSLSKRQAQVVEYRFFGGLTHAEIAEVLEVSVATVRLDWRLARAWLSRELKP